MMLSHSRYVALLGAALVTLSCARSDRGSADTGAAATTSDSAAAAMGSMTGMNRSAPKDAEQEFLRAMVDHHAGLIQMATAAMTKASQSSTQGDAHALHTKQTEENKKMVGMLQSMYGETAMPMVMPEHKAMNDSLSTKTGAEYDRTFYRNLITHHREAIKMVNDMMPRMTKADIKQMAEKMKADQQKEITAFERKVK